MSSFFLRRGCCGAGVPIGVAYGIWGAMGTAVTAVLAALIFETRSPRRSYPAGLIIVGVLMVEFGSHPAVRTVMWLTLVGGIVLEVLSTLGIRGLRRLPQPQVDRPVVIGYVASFALIVDAVVGSMPVGIAYGVWSAAGVAVVARSAARFSSPNPHADDGGRSRAHHRRGAHHR